MKPVKLSQSTFVMRRALPTMRRSYVNAIKLLQYCRCIVSGNKLSQYCRNNAFKCSYRTRRFGRTRGLIGRFDTTVRQDASSRLNLQV
eukprot:scaffold91689_cov72-Phaeocystis_antarctica.AAC.1